jgi:hypothetical protein
LGALPASAGGVPAACETGSRKIEILSPFCDFSRPCRQENFPPRRAVHSLFRVCDRRRRGSAGPLFAVDAPRRELAPRFPAGTGADFSPASSDFKALGAFFCNFVILAVRQPEPRTVSRPPGYQILWVRGFRAHTISGRGFNLFKPLRRHFRATAFCRRVLSRRDPRDRNASDDQLGDLRRGGNKYRTTTQLWQENLLRKIC